MEKIEYGGWKNCYRIANKKVELIVTGDVGPRVIRFAFVDGENEFMEDQEDLGKTGGDEWRLYGGHRLWHAPEVKPRTYYPDNVPVNVEENDGFVLVTQPTEPTTGIQKELDFIMDPDRARVRVTHRLINRGMWTAEMAPWALSVMAPGGTAIIPQPPRGTHPECLLPCNTLTLWPYTDLSDSRWTFGNKYILLRQDAQKEAPLKMGVLCKDGWIAYARNGHLFVKTFKIDLTADYPDHGCTVEAFTNKDMLEIETLGPLMKLEPGQQIEHVETWHLLRDVLMPENDEEVDSKVLPRLKKGE